MAKLYAVSTHSRPKAAGRTLSIAASRVQWFQHTAARRRLGGQPKRLSLRACFNTQPPEGGWLYHTPFMSDPNLFQHTAARRRLVMEMYRPVAMFGFNTQPPEGGWRRCT